MCFLLWARELVEHKPHLVVQECTRDFDSDMLEEMLSEHYEMCVVVTDPSEQGHAVRRPRKYCILALRSSSFQPAWDLANYRRIARDESFGGSSIYFVATTTAQMSFRKELAKSRHIPPIVHGTPVPWARLLSCGIQRRLNGYVAVTKKRARRLSFVVANLLQNPHFAGSPGDFIPSLLKQSFLYGWQVSEGISGRHARPLLPMEYLLVQGLPLHSRRHPHFKHISRALTRRDLVRDSDIRAFAGNGMNAAQVGIALLFAVCSPRSQTRALSVTVGGSMRKKCRFVSLLGPSGSLSVGVCVSATGPVGHAASSRHRDG